MRLALPSHLCTWEPSSSSTRAVQAPLGPHGGAGILDCVCVERSLWILPPSASPWLCLCLGFSGLRGNDRAGLGALLRAHGPQASALRALSRFGAGPGLGISLWVPELPDLGLGLVLGVRVPGAAVCTIINLHLLAGSGGAAVSACGPSQKDWPKGQETLRVLSFSYSSHNTSCGTAQGLWFGWGRSKTF